jgi:uncharacterized membrane protein YhaH (DUF805 family)
MENLLSFDGRIRRKGYWIVGLALGIPNLILYFLLSAMSMGDDPNVFGIIILWLLMMAIAIVGLSLSVRRWHDLGKSGWWILITLVPIVGALYAFVMLGFMEGDRGHNTYGPAPEEGALL